MDFKLIRSLQSKSLDFSLSSGYTLMLWVQFTGATESRGVYLSNGGHSDRSHGIAMYYGNGQLEFVFK